jgi:DNA-binding PadR family transcriptional regulator
MANQKVLSEKSLQVLEILKSATAPMIMSEIEIENLNSANLTALVNRGLVVAEQVIVEVPTIVKRKVNAYNLTEKGKAFKGE